MNDTLDYFAETQIENLVIENLLKTHGKNETDECKQKLENGILFDDSLYLQDYNSQVFSCSEKELFPKNDLENNLSQCSRKSSQDSVDLPLNTQTVIKSEIIQTPAKESSIYKPFNSHSTSLNKEEVPCVDVFHSQNVFNSNKEISFSTETCIEETDNVELEVPETPLEVFNDNHDNEEKMERIKPMDSHNLSSWGLPESILKSYEKRKIISMFDWQLECLSQDGIIQENQNLVYSAPTSAGKTLVAEILAMKCLFERKKKVIFILPFISVVREKVYYFQDILGSSAKRVEGFMGSYNPPGGFQSVHMAVGTIEKCNSLINRLMEENKLEDIGLVIIDEMHLIGDPYRGYLLELLLTKLKYIMSKNENVQIQIIGMSATLPNLDSLAQWLDAKLYTTNFRPIPLHEMVYVSKEIYNNEFKLLRCLPSFPDLATDTDDILQLCLETIEKSSSVLIFCPTKNWCENLAQQIAMAFWRIGKSNSELSKILHKNLSVEKISEVLEQLKYCPSGLDKILKNTVAFGVAFHHAGLTMEERDIIEGGFRNGGIRLLIATSTLSSGVNLPARRVIIRSPIFNGRPIDILTYRQMIGRAGRMGIDIEGESILICQKSDYNTAKYLTQSTLKPVRSCLEDVAKFKRAILEIIASGVASSPEDLKIFSESTLIATQEVNSSEKLDPVMQVVEFLKKFNFIRLQKSEDGTNKYFPTALGKACLSSSLPPGEGLELFTELEKARQCLVLETELHLIYLVTPYSSCYQWPRIDWMLYLELWEKLPLSMKRVGEFIGVRESFIITATRGSVQDSPKLLIHKRFFIALALQDLVNEKPLEEVAAKFVCNRGLLQSLQQSASTFAGMVTSFSRQLGWSSIEILISQFQDRLQFGISRDLLDLMRLPCMNGKQSRSFFNAGIETLIQLANSNVDTIENILHKVMPFENAQEREGESEHDFKQRNKLRTIWITGKQGLTEREAAFMILQEARNYLEHEMGVKNIKWGEQIDKISEENDISSENLQNEIKTSNLESAQTVALREQSENSDKLKNNSQKRKVENEPKTSQKSQFELNNEIYEPTTKPKIEKLSSTHTEKLFNQTDETCLKTEKTSVKNSFQNEDLIKCGNKSQITDSGISLSVRIQGGNESIIDSGSDNDLFEECSGETIERVSCLSSECRKRVLNSNEHSYSKRTKIDSINNNREEFEGSSSDFMEKKHQVFEQIDLSKFYIIDVCKYEKLYHSFCSEFLRQKKISLSFACQNIDLRKIGLNSEKNHIKTYKYSFENIKVDGVAITWDGKHVFYLFMDDNGCEEKYNLLKKYLENEQNCVKFFDSKECIVMMNRVFGIDIATKVEDPKVLDWILEPDGNEKDFHSMISKYCLEAKGLSSLTESCRGYYGLGMNVENEIDSRMRASVESVVTWNLIMSMKELTIEKNSEILGTFELEMAVRHVIAKMEITGIGIDSSAMESLMLSVKSEAKAVEKKIFSLAGRKFSLSSSREIGKAIGLRTSKKISTNKQVLEESKHPISDLIILWRKLTCTLTKMLQPLSNSIKTNRVYGRYISHTSTGRISMQEPNIQNLAKDFEFKNPLSNATVLISCRNVFVPRNNCLFISADYCQLELRMLAHLSGDKLLCRILNEDGDIFKSIAAKWNNISEEEVTQLIRNQTKQICYGIIYGIGSRALAQQLKIDLEEATSFMENFKNTYPALKNYIQNVIDFCKENGYVQTLSGRRRSLPLIRDENLAIRSHAERQAVNTTIQGSAADLVKVAMVKVENSFNENFNAKERPTLVLHLHDELLFEVEKNSIQKAAHLLKKCLESTNLSVPFPVKLRIGESWGTLRENMM